ncbi:MAG: squalene/phytoene synthase family protein [Actinobacteria bacterium]|nr:squalene/phytoene synthase family protein [Actinomycetota bacterium]
MEFESRLKALPTVEEIMARSKGENFPVAMKILPRHYGHCLQAIYGFARLIDCIGDEIPYPASERLAVLQMLKEGIATPFAQSETAHPEGLWYWPGFVNQAPTIRSILDATWLVKKEKGLETELFVKLIEANIQDQIVSRYSSFEDLLGYCDLSANPIGRMVLGIFGVTNPQVLPLSDAVCTALQIVEHLQDVREDALNGRIYLPKEDMDLFGVSEDELVGPASSPSLKALVAYEAERASHLLRSGNELVSLLNGWAKVAVAGFVAGGLAALDAIRGAGYDVLAKECKPTRRMTLKHLAEPFFAVPFRYLATESSGGEGGDDGNEGGESGEHGGSKSNLLGNVGSTVERAHTGTGETEAQASLEHRHSATHTTLADAYQICLAVTAEQARNFYYGIRLLDPERRSAMAALYAMARRIDDVVDCFDETKIKLDRLQEIRQSLSTLSVSSSDPVEAALADVLQRYPVPIAALFELVDGCEADALGRQYNSFDELVGYCQLVAGSVGRMTIGVLGVSEPERGSNLANSLGIGLQLVNILRDVVTDKDELGRVYLPADDLRRFGCLPDLSGPEIALERVVSLEAARARFYIDEGLGVLSLMDARSRACVAAMAGIYERLLAMVERDPGVVLHGRIRLPSWKKGVVAARSLLGAVL